jgi:hypothetical protein
VPILQQILLIQNLPLAWHQRIKIYMNEIDSFITGLRLRITQIISNIMQSSRYFMTDMYSTLSSFHCLVYPRYLMVSLSRCCLFFSCLANLAQFICACFLALWLVLLIACLCCLPSLVIPLMDQKLEFVVMLMESVCIASIAIFSLFPS